MRENLWASHKVEKALLVSNRMDLLIFLDFVVLNMKASQLRGPPDLIWCVIVLIHVAFDGTKDQKTSIFLEL